MIALTAISAALIVEKRILNDAEIEDAITGLCTTEGESGPTKETFKSRIKAKTGHIDAAAPRLTTSAVLSRHKHGRHIRYAQEGK